MVLVALLLGTNVAYKRLDHDEHQFIASAALWARHGLLPYRDYPYFHTPYLVFVYGALFKFSGHLLLTARLACAVCSFGTLALLFTAAMALFRHKAPRHRFAIAAGAVALVLFNPAFAITTCRAWNHDIPTFFMFCAMAIMWLTLRTESRRGLWLMAAAGAIMGLAIGMRLTFAPPAAMMAIIIPLFPAPRLRTVSPGRRLALVCAFSLGVIGALLPAIMMFARYPAGFFFGNFDYPTLNTAFRFLTGYRKSMSGPAKLKYLFTDIVLPPASFPLFLLIVATFLPRAWYRALFERGARRERKMATDNDLSRRPYHYEIAFLSLLLCSVLFGSFAPTPLFSMYFYTPLPLIVLIMLCAAASLPLHDARRQWWYPAMMVVVAVVVACGASDFRKLPKVWDVPQWTPMYVHRAGLKVVHSAPAGTIFVTAAPLFPLEGGGDVFPDYATGPFLLRVAEMIPENRERAIKSIDYDDLEANFLQLPRRALLTGKEPVIDADLIHALHADRFRRRNLNNGLILWIDPDTSIAARR